MKALVIVHLSTLDHLTSVNRDRAEDIAAQLMDDVWFDSPIGGGLLVVVDQQWDFATWDSAPRKVVLESIQRRREAGRATITMKFDESTKKWAKFLPQLEALLRRHGVTEVGVSGLWYDPENDRGCAYTVEKYLRSRGFKVQTWTVVDAAEAYPDDEEENNEEEEGGGLGNFGWRR